MKFINIGSGSKGNCTIFYEEKTMFLIDVGVSKRRIVNALKLINKKLEDINFVLLTHTHSDHISNIKLFDDSIIYSLKNEISDEHNFNEIYIEKQLIFNDFSILPIKTSHDVISCGFIIKHNDEELVYITDTGYIPLRSLELIKDKKYYIIESNYDEYLVLASRRSDYVKARNFSCSGHLSNGICGAYLSELIGKETRAIFLAHISEQCNDEETALSTVKEHLVNFKKIKIEVLKQREMTIYDEN